MKKPIKISVDTINNATIANYDNIRKGDTLSMTIKIFQGSASLDLTGQSMHIILKKSDGYCVEKIVNSVTGNNFVVPFDVQATLAVGNVEGEIQISDSNGTNISNHFTFEVGASLADDIVIQSSNQIETLQQIEALISSYNSNADNLATQNALAIQYASTLESDIATGTTLDTALKSDITTGNALDVTLKSDISAGNTLDTALKSDISNGNTTNSNLQISITNGNEVITNLANVNWSTIQSYIDLMNIMLSGMTITDENNIDITDENDIEITM